MTEHFDKVASTWDQDPMKVERSRLTALNCKQAPLKSRKKLLDFGGGTGLLSLFLQDSFDQITLADSSNEMLKIAEEKIKEANINNIKTVKIQKCISEIKDKYSAIISLMTLHHIPEVEEFISKSSKLLIDEGALIIADLYKEDGSFHKQTPDFDGHNGFEISSLSEKLEVNGFSVIQVTNYYEIEKEVSPEIVKKFPLFFLFAEKNK